jgi:uncharacterized membrane protein
MDFDRFRPFGLGRALFGLSMIGFGIGNVSSADGVVGLEPLPPWGAGHAALAVVTGLVLIACGAGLLVHRFIRPAAIGLAGLLGAWVLLLQLPPLIARGGGNEWTTTTETLALWGGALMLAGPLSGGSSVRDARVARLGLVCFAVSLPIFGILHFVYHGYVARIIPSWIPAHLAWTYGIGVAFIAAGVSIFSGVWARLAASLLGVMFGSWVLLLHGPLVAAALQSRNAWTNLLIALAMSGCGWILAAHVARTSHAGARATAG